MQLRVLCTGASLGLSCTLSLFLLLMSPDVSLGNSVGLENRQSKVVSTRLSECNTPCDVSAFKAPDVQLCVKEPAAEESKHVLLLYGVTLASVL